MAKTSKPQSWRDAWSIHPSADVFPLMSTEQLSELAEDIRVNGLKVPPIFWYDPANDNAVYVIDGRNRLDAMESLGWELVDDRGQPNQIAKGGWPPAGKGGIADLVDVFQGVDPANVVIAANIRRRHLTKQQQARLLVKAVKAGEQWQAERTEIVNMTKSVPRTSDGKVRGSTKGIRGKAVEEAAKHDISEATVDRAIAEEKTETEPEPKPKPKPKPKQSRKPTVAQQQAADEAVTALLDAAKATKAKAKAISDLGREKLDRVQDTLNEIYQIREEAELNRKAADQ